jgi:site-specific DNA-methyltransferase (adenine-specific)
MEYLIKTYTNEGDVVLDCCMGSGSTGVGCINTNRSFIGVELNKDYFDIAHSRICGESNKIETIVEEDTNKQTNSSDFVNSKNCLW